MSHELHYTSAARGLKSGSVGYCTVEATANLPGPLAVRLEGLSAYRAVFPHGHPSADRNPWVISHAKLSIAGTTYNVLSRISDAGLDYSERDNKYAHHVAIDPHERPEAGPAWLASRPGFLDQSWSGAPRTRPRGRDVHQGDRPPGVCRTWAEWFDDAGWAGAVAESFLADPNRPVHIVFEPGQDLLPLFVEALALLPKARRWDVGFSTYYTGQSQGLACPWRGVLRGSPEEQQARRLPGALVLDPRQPPGLAQGGALVEQARTGIAPPEPERPAVPAPVRFTGPVRVEPRPETYQIRDEAAPTPAASRKPKTPATPRAQRPGPPAPASKPAELEFRQKLMFAGMGLAVTLLLGIGGATAAWIITRDRPAQVVSQQIDRYIKDKQFQEAQDYLQKELESRPRLVQHKAVAEAKKKLKQALHDDLFERTYDEAYNAPISAEEPPAMALLRDLEEKTPDEKAKVTELAERRKKLYREKTEEDRAVEVRQLAARVKELIAPGPFDQARGRLEKARSLLDGFARERPILADREEYIDARRNFQTAEKRLEEERVHNFNRLIELAEAAVLWVPEPIEMAAARSIARTPEEFWRVEDLTRRRNSRHIPAPPRPADSPKFVDSPPEQPAPKAPATPAPGVTPEKVVEDKARDIPKVASLHGLSTFELPPTRTNGTDMALSSAKKRFELEDRAIARVTLLGLETVDKKVSGKVELIGQGVDSKRFSISFRPAEPGSAAVPLGTFTWETNTVVFERGSRDFSDSARNAYDLLKSCVLKVTPENGEPIYCLLRSPWEIVSSALLATHLSKKTCLSTSISWSLKKEDSFGSIQPYIGRCVLKSKIGKPEIAFSMAPNESHGVATADIKLPNDVNIKAKVQLNQNAVVLTTDGWPDALWNQMTTAKDEEDRKNKLREQDKRKILENYLKYVKQILESAKQPPLTEEEIKQNKTLISIIEFLSDYSVEFTLHARIGDQTFVLPLEPPKKEAPKSSHLP